MLFPPRRTAISILLALVAFGATPSRVLASSWLWWDVIPWRAISGTDGRTFQMIGHRGELCLAVVFVFEGISEEVLINDTFAQHFNITLLKDAKAIPFSITESTISVTAADQSKPAPLIGSATLAPGSELEVRLVIKPRDEVVFGSGEYVIGIDIDAAVRSVRWAATNAPWDGRAATVTQTVIRIAERPENAMIHRAHVLAEADAATDRQELGDALGWYASLLKLNPSDRVAQLGVGETYLLMGRYREAARAFEILGVGPGDGITSIDLGAAHAYLALGQDAKADALLRTTGGSAGDAVALREKLRLTLLDRGWFPSAPLIHGGDVNSNGEVDCGDVTRVKLALGRRVGQLGFDSSADVVSDNIIDVRDLAFVSRRMRAGSTCR